MAIQVMTFRHNAEKNNRQKMHDAMCAGPACASVLKWNPQTRKISTSFPLRKSPTSLLFFLSVETAMLYWTPKTNELPGRDKHNCLRNVAPPSFSQCNSMRRNATIHQTGVVEIFSTTTSLLRSTRIVRVINYFQQLHLYHDLLASYQ